MERKVERYSKPLWRCDGCIEIKNSMCTRFEKSVAFAETEIAFGVCWFKVKAEGINK